MTASAVAVDFDRCSCAVAVHDRRGQAYNEEAFQYLLAIERDRGRRARRPFLLCQVEVEGPAGTAARIDPVVATRLFTALWRCLRETDVVGWYRDGQVIGAVLTELGGDPGSEVLRLVAHRVEAAVRERLPVDIGRRVRLRLSRNAEAERVDSAAHSHSLS